MCKDGDGRVGIKVKAVNKGIFVCLVTKDSPAAIGGLRLDNKYKCTVYYVPCTMYRVLCTVYYVPFTMHCVLCTVYYVPCTTYCVLCTVYYVLYTLYLTYCVLQCSTYLLHPCFPLPIVQNHFSSYSFCRVNFFFLILAFIWSVCLNLIEIVQNF